MLISNITDVQILFKYCIGYDLCTNLNYYIFVSISPMRRSFVRTVRGISKIYTSI